MYYARARVFLSFYDFLIALLLETTFYFLSTKLLSGCRPGDISVKARNRVAYSAKTISYYPIHSSATI